MVGDGEYIGVPAGAFRTLVKIVSFSSIVGAGTDGPRLTTHRCQPV